MESVVKLLHQEFAAFFKAIVNSFLLSLSPRDLLATSDRALPSC